MSSDLVMGLTAAGVLAVGGYFLYSAYDVNAVADTSTKSPSTTPATKAPKPAYVPPPPTPAQIQNVDWYAKVKTAGGTDEQAGEVVANANMAVNILTNTTALTQKGYVPSPEDTAAAAQTLVDLSQGNFSAAATTTLSPPPAPVTDPSKPVPPPAPVIFFSDSDKLAVEKALDADFDKFAGTSLSNPLFQTAKKNMDTKILAAFDTLNNHTSKGQDVVEAYSYLSLLEGGKNWISVIMPSSTAMDAAVQVNAMQYTPTNPLPPTSQMQMNLVSQYLASK